ncbi:hypothetical protein [Tateyamaria sp.]|uniref:hypothetical protein n=1 Tax=Tateyamaria sp. TaxID=1929288 RepID=UPI003B2215D6
MSAFEGGKDCSGYWPEDEDLSHLSGRVLHDCCKKGWLEGLINAHSLESRTDTPDFILAEYVVEGLRALEHQHNAKRAWNSPDMKGATV